MVSPELYVWTISILIVIRNALIPEIVIPRYGVYPYKLLGNFIRCSNNYYSSKGQKSFLRNLFFNSMRCVLSEIIKHLLYKNRVIIPDVIFTF